METAVFVRRALTVLLAGAVFASGCNLSRDVVDGHALQKAAQKRIAYGKNTGTHLNPVASCDALERELKELAAGEIETWFERRNQPDAAAADAVDNAGAGSSTYTNNQVAGIDEADFVKTDGARLYVLHDRQLHRFAIPEPGQITPAGSVDIEGWSRAMLVHGDNLLVLSAVESNDSTATAGTGDMPFMLSTIVKATLLQWPDNKPPRITKEIYFDGQYLTARRIADSAHVVLHGSLPNAILDRLWEYSSTHADDNKAKQAALEDLDALPLSALLPQSYVRTPGGALEPRPYTENDCAAFVIPADSNSSGVTSIVSVGLRDGDMTAPQHVVSNRPTVYASRQRLYIAESAQDWWWFDWAENSGHPLNVHFFNIEDTDVHYIASARAEGMPVNQFALDEHDGVLRVATTLGGWWTNTPAETRIYTFGVEAQQLRPLGKLTGIAPNERLFAARFAGDTGYLVTFETIDPLFTIDLADPANPAIIGELEIPGFSTYLHRVADDRLLAVGRGGDDTGANWNTTVSLFDVGDLTTPSLLDRQEFANDNDGWSWSEALHEHKAFQFHESSGLLALPFGASRETDGTWEWVSTLELVKLEDDALHRYGSIDHSSYFDSHGETALWYSSPDIRRSFFVGGYIYAISSKAVTVHPLANPSVVAADALIPSN